MSSFGAGEPRVNEVRWTTTFLRLAAEDAVISKFSAARPADDTNATNPDDTEERQHDCPLYGYVETRLIIRLFLLRYVRIIIVS